MDLNNLFASELNIVNIGSKSFVNDYERQSIENTHIAWRMPANGNLEVIKALKSISKYTDLIEKANIEASNNIKSGNAFLVGIKRAIDAIPNMSKKTILHAGPPIAWQNMCGPARGAVIGALIYEGLATTQEEAIALADSGEIKFAPCHEYATVGPMAGIVSASMPVHIIENKVFGIKTYATINEGLGKVLRYGANSDEVIARLHWLENTFMNVLNDAILFKGGIDLKNLIAQGLQMGDECHNRNKAVTSLFLKEVVMAIFETKYNIETQKEVLNFIVNNDHYFLNLSMAACKAMLESASNIKNSSIIYIMARNGVDFGVKVSGLDSWYQYPANYIKGLYFAGYTDEDAARDIGDSAITETFGIGGFCMGAAPAIVQFVGGTVQDALNYTSSMYEITQNENKQFMLPAVDFKGIPQGIDLLKVVQTGVLPIINTGIAHKNPGVGQIGAGIVTPPMEIFNNAILDFARKLGEDNE